MRYFNILYCRFDIYIMLQYSKEQLWQLYEGLPDELKAAVFSETNADNLYEICQKNEIKDNSAISEIAKKITYVFLGLLKPNELQDIISTDLNIEKKQASQIANEINNYIFLPVRKNLEQLYQIEMKPSAMVNTIPTARKSAAMTEKNKSAEKIKSKIKDRYREAVV
ncbi:MAG: hypothetical protein A3F95_02245 [Candidatus Nealsonbacteria bacterium RIFCSPLOWO2_12_FULL_39_31]|uniref:Uncharacterized protein n=3 Tax=Candidatus Nealsoniibacteriota TaxID=1817911 RepID=A0A1G2EQ38_9BACT|nr:MAG: hypothetical protein US88_C0016G0012 [Parcubacteria group bacterium GW2011_GWA2_38_27]KKQ96926.1 MAG: hypothetical protein UT22_C0021G0007 [Parcubacteria group bacterium GW2011_GWC2_39_11]OGZ20095.1 MAG: hypothetical protein A2626_01470 [Candidatus Nealsonbacteria bacterium RIFCSPHIGHO2_01_FULL_38_55]OGZ22117.1 MAG: hypothetical protein A3C48_02080 [Candidatus Nealsonbacteria bacterium RIFCSPHIGHO2_02_FULL_38_75]OGZ23399.1 MAG: hypothetical protein A2981_01590 [Candidatus Nealsonbacteri